jgi:hypothetical protein
MLPSMMAIGFLLVIPSNMVQGKSVAWHVLYASATYVLAGLAAMALPWVFVWKGPYLAQLALGMSLMTLFAFGLILGSLIGLSALIAGLHVPRSDRWMCLLLMFVVWGAYELLLLEWIRRRTLHLRQRS